MSTIAAQENALYLACLNLSGRRCLVVGAGPVALEKAEGLIQAGASVTVVAPDFDPAFADLEIERVERPYETRDLHNRFLVVAATSDNDVNRRVFADAEARSLLCNVADVPELCSFILPAIHRAGPIAVAVSTGGASPALAQRLRNDIAGMIGPEHVELAHRLRELRPWAKENLSTYEERRDYFAGLVHEALA
jgi:precorrin-2 dehydrogenase / sirohydrochlorin ferrochelatase